MLFKGSGWAQKPIVHTYTTAKQTDTDWPVDVLSGKGGRAIGSVPNWVFRLNWIAPLGATSALTQVNRHPNITQQKKQR